MDQACGNCRFFLLQDRNVGSGLCRRYPPTVLAGEWITRRSLQPNVDAMVNQVANIAGQNPPTSRDLWCGEFQEVQRALREADA